MDDTHLRDVPGFITFHLLRGPDREDHTLYSSHSVGAAGQISRPGRGRTRSAAHIIRPVPTSRFISGIPSSKASR
jgi:hypothetical protein